MTDGKTYSFGLLGIDPPELAPLTYQGFGPSLQLVAALQQEAAQLGAEQLRQMQLRRTQAQMEAQVQQAAARLGRLGGPMGPSLQEAAAQQQAAAQLGQWGPMGPPPLSHPGVENDPAAQKAHALLLRLLSPEQCKAYQENLAFYERREKKVYRLSYHSLAVIVYSVNDRNNITPLENWCAFCPNCPREDTLIAQLLLIRDDPLKLRAKARVMECAGGVVDGHDLRPGWANTLFCRQFVQQVSDERAMRIMRRAGY